MLERCAACNSESWTPAETVRGYRLALCASCGATFTLNPDYGAERYVAAYDGTERKPVAGPDGYVYLAPTRRLSLETIAVSCPPPRLTPAQGIALRWLKACAPAGAVIIDCGCGSGLFLRALRGAGLRAAGVEISSSLVGLLRRRGMDSVCGAAPDFPWEASPPFAITFFEVLEHLAEPSAVMSALVRRFPRAAILASVPSPDRVGLLLRGERGPSDYPPNHYIRWTPLALQVFFEGRGFSRVTVHVPPPAGSELLPGLGQLLKGRAGGRPLDATPGVPSVSARLGATAILWLHWIYRVASDVVGAVPALRARARGGSAASMLAVAEPARTP